jgi:hypothetical protein
MGACLKIAGFLGFGLVKVADLSQSSLPVDLALSALSSALRVTSVALCNRRRPVDFRYAPLATEDAWRCNMSRRAITGLVHQ